MPSTSLIRVVGSGYTVFSYNGKRLNFCLAAETTVITKDGPKPISELAGKKVTLLTRTSNGTLKWVKVDVKSFGRQPLMKISLSRYGIKKEIHATPEHRWFVRREFGQRRSEVETVTRTLQPGQRLVSAWGTGTKMDGDRGVRLSSVGVMHGFTFGDGTIAPGGSAKVTLYGEKDASVLKWFSSMAHTSVYTPSEKGIGTMPGLTVHDLPYYFKELPSLNESRSYLLGWLAGYFAADGSIDRKGQPRLDSANRTHLEFVQRLAYRLGIPVMGIVTHERVGFEGRDPSKIHTLFFAVGALPEEFYIIPGHQIRATTRSREIPDWKVESVEATDRFEEVFCAVVPETHCFVLEGNILTSNCQEIQDRQPDPVAAPQPVQPLDESHPIEIAFPKAAGPGTLTLSIFDQWDVEVWRQFSGYETGSINDIVDLLARSASIGGVTCVKLIKSPPPKKTRAVYYHGAVIVNADMSEDVRIESMTVGKTVTIMYTKQTRRGG